MLTRGRDESQQYSNVITENITTIKVIGNNSYRRDEAPLIFSHIRSLITNRITECRQCYQTFKLHTTIYIWSLTNFLPTPTKSSCLSHPCEEYEYYTVATLTALDAIHCTNLCQHYC